MRPLIIGILLFLIWSFLSSWYYVNNIYTPDDLAEENTLVEEDMAEPEIIDEKPALPEAPEALTLYFNYNQSEFISNESISQFISESIAYLQADQESCILISGYTCSRGSESYNKELGKKRAEAVKNYLMKQGLSDKCIKTISYGENDPARDNSTEEGREKNRRARLEIELNKTK